MDLAEDITFQILLTLPVISLLRFRCVCKQWCAVIDSLFFKDAYLALRRARAVDDKIFSIKVRYEENFIEKIFVTGCYSDYESFLLESASAPRPPLSSNDFEIPAWTPPPPREYRPYRYLKIIGHVNGLICVLGENWFDITLINPALREYRILPVPNLGGFQCVYIHGVGFGYDDVNDDYIVVSIVFVCKEDRFETPYKHLGIVYRLSTDTWTILDEMSSFLSERFASENHFMGLPCEQYNESIFSHGAIHWCIGTFRYEPVLEILAFNTSTELFHVVQFPHGWKSYRNFDDMTDNAILPFLFNVDKSTIALVGYTSTKGYPPVDLIEVWVMKQYGDGESWTKQHSISFLPIRKTLSFWRRNKLLLISIEGFFICYDLLKGQLCEQEHCVKQWDPSGWEIQLVTGHESFVSVKPVSNQGDAEGS